MQAVSIMLTRSIKYRIPEILINYTYYLLIEYLLHIRYNKHNMLFLKKKKKILNGVTTHVFTQRDTEAQSC